MIFSNDVFIQILTVILGFFGFWIAKYIRNHKVKDAPLVCMVGFDCHTVVHSDYAKFLGVPVEIFGMIYYALIFVVYFVFTLTGYSIPIILIGIMILLSFTAFLFSIYLIAVQIFILKKGCSWCIVSAFICFLIFVLTMIHYDFSSVSQIFIS